MQSKVDRCGGSTGTIVEIDVFPCFPFNFPNATNLLVAIGSLHRKHQLCPEYSMALFLVRCRVG